MDDETQLRALCLSLACGQGLDLDRIVSTAQSFYGFLKGDGLVEADPAVKWPPDQRTA